MLMFTGLHSPYMMVSHAAPAGSREVTVAFQLSVKSLYYVRPVTQINTGYYELYALMTTVVARP
jgi:hypothetical protein